MIADATESEFKAKIKSAVGPAGAVDNRALRSAFTARLRQVAARPDVVPIQLDGRRVEVRRGATILSAAMKNGVRLMHVCGARTLCATCRVVVEAGEDNLTPMRGTERFSLRWHLSMSPRTRLACQARVNGPVEVESVFPLCGELPNG
ncbi:MAG TPA: 2Fe-2S iron-sulfur cluster-binding protein [Patescibacteria group bacterium]|nr:2Fe-2S iron-sulfur cluster-binding protein [Patescibacteria group bacterium]